MINVSEQLDTIEQNVMSELKDFQRATVERIDYLFQHHHNRVLVSDEVGLGKTLVARGVIAKFAKIRKNEGDDLVKVIYICSNSAIAEQNLNKLMISRNITRERSDSSRLSMQHLNIISKENDPELKNRYIQLIPLTPETSFRMTSGSGIVDERSLMFAILKRIDQFKPYEHELEIMFREDAPKAWDSWCRKLYEDRVNECDQQSHGIYLEYMLEHVPEELGYFSDNILLSDALICYLKALRYNQRSGIRSRDIIAKLRIAFAKVSLSKLEPDIVIMDEFQRFRFLINADPESDLGLLVDKFFKSNNMRILLLSATPYKMYSTLEEIDEMHVDEHYSEFLDVMKFLKNDKNAMNSFKAIWSNYSVCLRELSEGNTTVIQAAKNDAENAMYENVCRTERITEQDTADMIDDGNVKESLNVYESDIKSYVQAQNVLRDMEASFNTPIDYVKSCPYIMSFMNDYQLKKKIENYYIDNPDRIEKVNKDCLWIARHRFNSYDKVQYSNARLKAVMMRAIPTGAEKLLWIPPSKPYYELGGPFRNTSDFTKTIIFSSWEMVPRMIASMLSYEAERLTIGSLDKSREEKINYFHDAKKRYPASRYSFSLKEDSPTRMTMFSLLYPSYSLTELYDPNDCMNRGLDCKQIEREIKGEIKERLSHFPDPKGGNDDLRWYYMIPMIWDDEDRVRQWLEESRREQSDQPEDVKKGYTIYFKTLEKYYDDCIQNSFTLGRRPSDLIDVLTDMVLASPAICVQRAFNNYQTIKTIPNSFWATEIALAFLNKMDSPESLAAIEICYGRRSDDAHWKNQLTYNKQGNIQAVFDEYMHLIASENGNSANLIEQIKNEFIDSMKIRSTAYPIDTYQKFKSRVTGEGKAKNASMRTHYAVAFTKGQGKESDADRKRTVRNAFNSPFRPFVLASTSIGQEGLDFHNYCRRIVHWNLPSNPIDLEQREGRINRYKCLAIRQNVAKRYGSAPFEQHDIWEEMFDRAKRVEKAKAKGASDLLPFWGLTEEPGMVKIERIVPMYPLSRDEIQYDRLIKILSLYRLTLGQARQEELLEYLMENSNKSADELQKLFINLRPYYRRKVEDNE